MAYSLLALLAAFMLAMLISPLVIRVMRKLKAGQPILSYVDNHIGKSGTPTMGGLIFVLPAAIVTAIMGGTGLSSGKYAAIIIIAYAVIGFLDDFIKVRYRDNKGLKAYQKVIAQLAVAIVISIYAYKNDFIGTSVNVPFTSYDLELGWFYIPFSIFIFIAITNSVNLTDGLDGLASSTGVVYFTAFLAIIVYYLSDAVYYGDAILENEYTSMAVFAASMAGGLLAFFFFNAAPAKIIMGDTGALALGGGVGAVAVFTGNPFLILIIGIMYVISSISVIIQVTYFKLTGGKRIFLMAPLHHHLEYKGIKEYKIVAYYSVITFVMAVIALISVK
jgi:phospho-N-acetylmuramoyl-pentapeptide-transferase